MAYDQLFKETIQELLREFMLLFYPEAAARLDFTQVTFLNKETFTDFPEGKQREADVVAQIATLDGTPRILLVHVEVEAKKRRTFPARMFEYYMLFRVRKRLLVFPIVLYLSRGAGGLTEETHTDTLFGKEVLRFTYGVIGIRDLFADDYLEKGSPLASALSAFMRRKNLGKVAHKRQAMRQIAVSGENEARIVLLTNLIETGLPLEGEEAAEFERLLQEDNASKEVTKMISVYEERGIEKGIAMEREKAKEMISVYEERGIERGILRDARQKLLKVLRHRFGELPETVTTRIENIAAPEELDALFDRALDAENLTALNL